MEHLNRQIPPEAHTSMYNFHKYWSRKTWNVVGRFIERYCPENGIVFDPFSGSGVTAIEALKANRKAIICDISPLATELTRLTIKPLSIIRLKEAFERIEKTTKKKILDLYLTKCRKCNTVFPINCAIWVENECQEIRYKKCPVCGDSRKKDTKLVEYDLNVLKSIDDTEIHEFYPRNPLYHVNGNPFKEKQRYESLDELFTKRNLIALALLMDSIENEKNKEIRDFLKIAFTSMVHLCSKMNPISEGGHFTPFSSAWTQHSFWYPSGEYMEQNVWFKFESSINGHQGLIKAKNESNRYFDKVKFGKNLKDVIEGDSNIFIYNGSCLDLMKEMNKHYPNTGCVDYIFTDPPYDSSIQYGELTFLWVAWLKKDKGYLEMIDSDEVINNPKQNKDFGVYTSLLRDSFRGMFDVLKPHNYLTLTFHNPKFSVRNSTIRTGTLSGFELEKIHHQELKRPSAKSLLQPFGSAQGDFYLRFHKPAFNENGIKPEKVDELRFENIVIDTTIQILAERGEPTPYTIILNAIDPELAKRGYFPELNTGLNIDTVLKKHLDNEFILVSGKIGDATGKLWWFKNPNLVKHLEGTPLSERVEQTVLRQLQAKGKVTFTDMWEAISIEFPNSLTTDQTTIKTALNDYARPASGGFWLIKPLFKPGFIEKEHSTIIALLSEIGIKAGYNIYIGKNEQSHILDTPRLKKTGLLNQFMSYFDVNKIVNIVNPDIVGDIDLLWLRENRIHFAFEVECTTSMTSALLRGSNLDKSTNKIMLIPSERIKQFNRKMKAPLFSERFKEDNWSIVLFEVLYQHWNIDKSKLSIYDILNKMPTLKTVTTKNNDQLSLFQENN